jgi:UDP-N-acetylglucosamine 2-epimerase (non-hydrolysing)
MAPVVLALRKLSWANVRVLATAQHRQLLDQGLKLFDIAPDIDLDAMLPNQTL